MNEKDFSEIVNKTKKIVLSAVGKNLAERFSFAIDDVVQETYLRAFKSLSRNQFKGESSISTWLYTIARNESYRMNFKLEREEKKIEKLKNLPAKEDTNTGFAEKYLEILKKIPEKYSTILLHYYNGFSEKEIAGKLEISKGTVKSRNSRGKEMVRKLAMEEK